MKKGPIVAVIVVVVAILGLTLANHKNANAPGPVIKPVSGAAAKKAEEDAKALPVPTNAVSIADMAFAPLNITVPVGTTVHWNNNDSMANSIVADDGSFDSGTVAVNAAFTHTFTTPGTFKYHSGVHSNMTGSVVVRPQ